MANVLHIATGRADARVAIAAAFAALAFGAVAFAPQVLNDGDTFLHVAAGIRMLAERAILFADPFSYTRHGAPWDAHEWLAEVMMGAAYRAGGWNGLVLLFAFAGAAAAGLLAWQVGRWTTPMAQTALVLLALSGVAPSLLARPHLLALPLLIAWTGELAAAGSENRAPSLWLLPLMTLWVNIHASFIVGLALAVAMGLDAVLATGAGKRDAVRGWSLFCIAAAAAACLNPHFVAGVLFPLHLSATHSLAYIDEWKPTDVAALPPAVLVAAAGVFVAITRGVRLSPVRALILIGLVWLMLAHRRHQMIFATVAPLLFAEPLAKALAAAAPAWSLRRSRAVVAGAAGLLLVLTVVRAIVPLVRSDSPVAPISALSHVPAPLRQAPVLNDYSFGGYLIFAGVHPFIDSRVELYGDPALDIYAALTQADRATLDRTVTRYGVRWTVLSAASPLVAELDRDPAWHRLYADRYAVVHVRDGIAPVRDARLIHPLQPPH